MMQCWSEGELRAYVDGELPSGDMHRLAEHLKECAACGGRCAELERRSAWVSRRMEALPEAGPVVQIPRLAWRPSNSWRWAGAAVAALLAVAFVALPKRPERVVVVTPAKAPLPVPAITVPLPVVKPEMMRRLPRKPAAPAKPKPQVQDYVALDNEPIESGIVVRVGLSGGKVPADVIFGPDGRPRAIRLVSDSLGDR